MDLTIASILALDGLTNGAIYALLALATVLVFAVTRVIFIAQGEFVAVGALTLAALQQGQTPATVHFLLTLTALVALLDGWAAWRTGQGRRGLMRVAVQALPGLLIGLLALWAAPRQWPLTVQAALSLAIVTPMGAQIYRLAYQSLADASVLVLLIVSVGVHFTLTGLGLVFFGAEGSRNPAFWDASFSFGPLALSGQTVIIMAAAGALIA